MQEKEVTWGNPAAAGIVGLCSVVIPLAALNLGWIPIEGAPILISWLLFGGIVQLICGLIEYRRGGLLIASALLVFGLLLCIAPAFSEIIKIWTGNFTIPNTIDGVGFLVVAVFVIAYFIGTGLVSWFLFVTCMFLVSGLWLVGLAGVGAVGGGVATLGWYLMLIFALLMLYLACALFLNELFEKPVLPIGDPLFKINKLEKNDTQSVSGN